MQALVWLSAPLLIGPSAGVPERGLNLIAVDVEYDNIATKTLSVKNSVGEFKVGYDHIIKADNVSDTIITISADQRSDYFDFRQG